MTHADWLILGYTTVIIIFGIVYLIDFFKNSISAVVSYHCRSILSPESIFFPVSALFFMLAFRYQFKQSDMVLRVILS